MAKNQVYSEALHIPLPVPSGTKSGDPVVVGSLVGVAITDRETGETEVAVWRNGAWDLAVDGAVTEVGTPLYIVADGTRQTQLVVAEPAADGVVFGYALATKSAAVATIPVAVAQV